MRYFGTYNRQKGLFTDSKDIVNYQQAREDDHNRSRQENVDNEPDGTVSMWLLCHPENDAANAIFTKMLRLTEDPALDVSHDDVVSWLAIAIRCRPSDLVPRGEAVTIRDKPTVPADHRGNEWNTSVGITQTCLLLQYLLKCSLDKLSVDERANILFALLRIFSDSDEVAASPHAQEFVRRLYAPETRIEAIEAIAAIFFQLSSDVATPADAIRTLWKIVADEPLVMRLAVEMLICFCQRSDMVSSLPDFEMGDQMYCKQLKMMILELTSDDQTRGKYQNDSFIDLLNEISIHTEKKMETDVDSLIFDWNSIERDMGAMPPGFWKSVTVASHRTDFQEIMGFFQRLVKWLAEVTVSDAFRSEMASEIHKGAEKLKELASKLAKYEQLFSDPNKFKLVQAIAATNVNRMDGRFIEKIFNVFWK